MHALTLHAAGQDLSLGLPSNKMMITAVMSSTPAGGFFSDLASPAPPHLMITITYGRNDNCTLQYLDIFTGRQRQTVGQRCLTPRASLAIMSETEATIGTCYLLAGSDNELPEIQIIQSSTSRGSM